MASGPCFAHACGPLPELGTRVGATGYVWARLVENLAVGQRTPEEVVAAWLASPAHRANVLDPAVTELGLGRADGGPARRVLGAGARRPQYDFPARRRPRPRRRGGRRLRAGQHRRAAAGVGPLGPGRCTGDQPEGTPARSLRGLPRSRRPSATGPTLADRVHGGRRRRLGPVRRSHRAPASGRRKRQWPPGSPTTPGCCSIPASPREAQAVAGYDTLYWILELGARLRPRPGPRRPFVIPAPRRRPGFGREGPSGEPLRPCRVAPNRTASGRCPSAG